ncbi:hypothetical protein EE612_031153, partial [Oryza sativa]
LEERCVSLSSALDNAKAGIC